MSVICVASSTESCIEEAAENPRLLPYMAGEMLASSGADFLLHATPNPKTEKFDEESLLSTVRHLDEGEDTVDVQAVAGVLDCANIFNQRDVRDACEAALVRCLTADNCVQLRQLAASRPLPHLANCCDRFLADNFEAVIQTRGALQLPRLQVYLDVSTQLLQFGTDLSEKVVLKTVAALGTLSRSRPHLEESVVQLVLLPDLRVCEWTEETRATILESDFWPEKRSQDLKILKVKNGLSSARQLILVCEGEEGGEEEEEEEGEGCEVVNMRPLATAKLADTTSVCLVEVQDSLALVTISLCTLLQNGCLPASPTTGLPTYSQTSGCFIAHMHTTRCSFGIIATESELIAVGGFNREGCLDSSERYNSLTNSWKEVGKMRTRRGRCAIAMVDSMAYAVGGSDGRKELSSVEMLDTTSLKWQKIPSHMPTPRSCLAVAELEGKLYAAGGEHYSIPLKTLEAYNPETGTWQSLSPMTTPRRDLAMAACSGKFYAIGGKASSSQCYSSVECFNPTRNIWLPVAHMDRPRRNAAVVTIDDKIMVIGGYSGLTVLDSVEVYDPATDSWSTAPPLCVARSHASAVVYHGRVYVMGGYTGTSFLNIVECFEPAMQQWTAFI